MAKQPDYLRPYLAASKLHGASFPTLLWASPDTQEARFGAFASALDLSGVSLLDVGCGRGDLLAFLHARDIRPADYLGIEAVPALADAAEAKGLTVLRRDFILDPACLFTGSDVIALSGSLNTAPDDAFYATLKRCFDAAARHFVFNFLPSPLLAGAKHLYWRKPADVDRFCRNVLGVKPRTVDGYLEGDLTFVLTKSFT